MNIDDLIATAQPRTEEVQICARGDLVDAHRAAVEALHAAQQADDSLSGSAEVHEAAERVAAVEAEQEAATTTFVVSAVSRRKWADLVAEYPPSKEQRRAGHAWDPQRFAIGMVALCVVDPPLTLDQAERLADVLHIAEWNKLETAAVRLNLTETPHPKLRAATELLQANGQSSTTSGNGASPEVGSLAGSGEQ